MLFIIRYTDKTGERKEIEIEPESNVLSVTLPAQPDEGIVGIKVNVNSDAVIVDSHNGSKLFNQTFIDMISECNADGNLDPEDRGFIVKNWNK